MLKNALKRKETIINNFNGRLNYYFRYYKWFLLERLEAKATSRQLLKYNIIW
jgi:hypothetical protein